MKNIKKLTDNGGELLILLLVWILMIGTPVAVVGKKIQDAKKSEQVKQQVLDAQKEVQSNRAIMYNLNVNQHVK